MHASAFRKIAVRCRSAALGLLLAVLARSPAAQAWVEDVVTGSCESLVTYQSGTGVALGGQHYPGKWGITEPTLFIGSKALTDPDVMDEISISLTNPKPASGRGRPGWVCVQTVGLSIQFRAESTIGAIEWQHGKRPDSACAKEWKRMRAVIRAHEPKHVQDIDATVAASNKRMAKLRPIEGCGPSALAAQQTAAQSILQLMQAERLKIIDDLTKRAQRRDVEQAQIDCSKCSEGASFKDVTIDCVLAAAPVSPTPWPAAPPRRAKPRKTAASPPACWCPT